jgi:hypothetical protein
MLDRKGAEPRRERIDECVVGSWRNHIGSHAARRLRAEKAAVFRDR